MRHTNKMSRGLSCAMIIMLVLSMVLLAAAEDNRDFYKILGVKRSANDKEIKRAFKKLSLKYHPDKNPGDDEAKKKFQDVSAAHEVLTDSEKRRKYDRCGEKCVNEPDAPQHHDPFGFFDSFFGGGGGHQPEERTGPSMTLRLKLSLNDLYKGKEMNVKYTRKTICPHCRGSGADDPDHVKDCPRCGG